MPKLIEINEDPNNPMVVFSTVKNKFDTDAEEHQERWRDFVAFMKEEHGTDKDGLALCATFHGGFGKDQTWNEHHRSKETVNFVRVPGMDIDGMPGAFKDAVDILRPFGRAVVYTTFNHGVPGKKWKEGTANIRWVPLYSREVTAEEHETLWRVLNDELGGILDGAAKDASRLSYLRRAKAKQAMLLSEFTEIEAEPLDVETWLKKGREQEELRERQKAARDEERRTRTKGAACDSDSTEDAELAREALQFIDPDIGYGDWLAVAVALRDFTDVTLEEFDAWSSRGSKYTGSEDCAEVWNVRTQGKEATLGTIFHFAKLGGWARPRSSRLDQLVDAVSTKSFSSKEGKTSEWLKETFKNHELRYAQEALLLQHNQKVTTEQKYDTPQIAAVVRCYARIQSNGAPLVYDRSKTWCAPGGLIWEPWGICRSRALVGSWSEKSIFWHKVFKETSTGKEEKAPRPYTITSTAAIADQVEMNAKAEAEGGFFDDAPYGIAIGDEFYMVNGKGIERVPLTYEHRQLGRVNWKPTPEGDRKVEEILSAWFPDGGNELDLLLEFIGISILGMATHFQKGLIIYGPGGSGKSTLLELIKDTLPDGFTSNVKLTELGERFQDLPLVNSRVNMASELADGEGIGKSIKNPDAIKGLITGDSRQFEKKFSDVFDSKPRAGLIFAVNPNCFPSVSGGDNAFRRRWKCVEFKHTIRDSAKDDKRLKDRAHEYGYAFVMRCLKAAENALSRGRLIDNPSGDLVLEREWFASMDSVSAFVAACLEPRASVTEGLSPTEMRTYYKQFCEQNGYSRCVSNLKAALGRAGVEQDTSKTQGIYRYTHVLRSDFRAPTRESTWGAPF